jgi:hypothetical protein
VIQVLARDRDGAVEQAIVEHGANRLYGGRPYRLDPAADLGERERRAAAAWASDAAQDHLVAVLEEGALGPASEAERLLAGSGELEQAALSAGL